MIFLASNRLTAQNMMADNESHVVHAGASVFNHSETQRHERRLSPSSRSSKSTDESKGVFEASDNAAVEAAAALRRPASPPSAVPVWRRMHACQHRAISTAVTPDYAASTVCGAAPSAILQTEMLFGCDLR